MGSNKVMSPTPSSETRAAGSSSGNLIALLAYPLFFASGAAGLIYQVVWTRMLLARFGAGLYAVCAVLTAFMAGLALGSWLLGKLSDRLERPFRVYALIEIGIGVFGLILPFLFTAVVHIDAWAYGTFGQNFVILTSLRFVLTFLVMLAPTTLMGATLPVLSRFLVRQQDHLGLHVGWLYSMNTFGAMTGAFAAGFVLIALFGLRVTEWTAVLLNIIVGVVALLISMSIKKQRVDHAGTTSGLHAGRGPDLPVSRRRVMNQVLVAACVSGGVALAAQVLWSRSLVFSFEFLKNTTYTFSAMLTVFLAGLAIGSALIGPVIDSQKKPFRLYGIMICLIGISMIMSVAILLLGEVMKIEGVYDGEKNELNWMLAVLEVMSQTFAVLGIPTLLMGMAFPVAARVVVQLGRVGHDVGILYAVNTVGAIFGALLAGFIIVPLAGLTHGLILLGTIELLLGLWLLVTSRDSRRHFFLMASLGIVVLIFVFIGFDHTKGLQPMKTVRSKSVFYDEGPLATVAVLENHVLYRTIYVDGVGVAGTGPMLQTDQKSLAHLGLMMVEDPERVLTVGFGSGGASYSFQLHDRLDEVHAVEICRTVLDAAPHLADANHRFFGEQHPLQFAADDDRYSIILDDARAYLRYTDMTYDVIATDCTDLRYKSNANLYDLEYFEACRERLTDDGVVVVWMPLAGLSRDMFKVALRTFHRVFPEMAVFYMNNEPTHYILLVGWKDKVQIDFKRISQRLMEPDVRADLAELYLDDPVKLVSCFITAGEQLDEYVEGDDLNTENNPILEFESPKYGYGDAPLIDNLNDLMSIRESPRRFIVPGTAPKDALEKLERYEAALPYIIDGHAAYRNVDVEGAARMYMKARKMAPEDLSVSAMLRFPLIGLRIQNEPGYMPRMLMGRVLMILGEEDPRRLGEAWDYLIEARDIIDSVEKSGEDKGRSTREYMQIQGWLQALEREGH
jgi:spermidine synthase